MASTTNSSAPARDQVAVRAETAGEALGHRPQQVVADVVAEGVVDAAEAVDVDGADADPAAARLVERELELLGEDRSGGEAGQRVVVGVEAQPGLEVGALGDVLDQADHVPRLTRGPADERERGLDADG
jgi:hypothetical protein